MVLLYIYIKSSEGEIVIHLEKITNLKQQNVTVVWINHHLAIDEGLSI